MTPEQFREYQARGFALCRIPSGQKCPVEPLWQLNPVLEFAAFRATDAVGMILGPLSGRLMCVDLDFHSEDKEAWTIADEVLPATSLVDGRPGKPKAHRFYLITDDEWPDSVLPRSGSTTRQAMEICLLARFAGTRHFTDGVQRAIDLLGAGSQVVIPPSLHGSGDQRLWYEGECGQPASVSYADLLAATVLMVERLGLKLPGQATSEDAPESPAAADLDQVPLAQRIKRLSSYLQAAPACDHGKHHGFHAQQWRLACTCVELGVPYDDALPLYLQWNKASLTPDPDAVNQSTLARAYQVAVFGARAVADTDVDLSGLTAVISSEPSPSSPVLGKDRLAFTWFKDTVERKPDWLWRGYLLRGAPSVVGGRQGSSKGLFTVDLAARLTRGDRMPDDTDGVDPLKVLFVTREDDPEMALMPRLRMAGADMNLIGWTYGDFEDGTPIDTMAHGAKAIEQTVRENGIGLVLIDPLGAWVEDDANNGQQIRAVIDPMNRMARLTGCSVLFVAHLRKAPANDPMDAFAGSVQVTAACRVSIHIAAIDSGPDRLVTVAKTNFRKPETQMIYCLTTVSEDPDDPPVLVWRAASTDEVTVATATKNGAAPIVPVETVLELMEDRHRPIKEVARAIRRVLLPRDKRITVQGVIDALHALMAAGRAHEGRDAHGTRTVGLAKAPEICSAKDRAAAYIEAHPNATNAAVASACGCSRTLANHARKLVTPPGHKVDGVPCDQVTKEQNAHAPWSGQSPLASPIRGAGALTDQASGTHERLITGHYPCVQSATDQVTTDQVTTDQATTDQRTTDQGDRKPSCAP